ncbi:MAG: YebC/PmpR family DNA-binding transcriptional regulator [Hydrotalea sp.]|nr:YebC/PmpR family DNA-binding transcriptional regulator [Hydrotalea sp.]
MAGHSQFKNIMHRKGRQDKKRAQIFQKITREIMVSVKTGGDNPTGNSRLKLALQNARAHSMPKDNIERAIKKASGQGDGDNYESLRYEGFGPGGVAIMVEVLTDNKNRSVGDIRSLFSKHGGNLGESNSVAFMFQRVGHIHYNKDIAEQDKVFENALDAGADDISSDGNGHDIYVAPDDLYQVAEKLEATLGQAMEIKLTWKPTVMVDINDNDNDKANQLLTLMEQLDDHDDVQEVIANVTMDDALLAGLS